MKTGKCGWNTDGLLETFLSDVKIFVSYCSDKDQDKIALISWQKVKMK